MAEQSAIYYEYERTLLHIVELLEAIKETLDTTKSRCDSCQALNYGNIDHYFAFESLKGAITRVDKARVHIQNGLDEVRHVAAAPTGKEAT